MTVGWFALVLLAAAAAGCGGDKTSAAPGKPAAGPPPIPVTVTEVVRRSVPVELKAIGTVEAHATISVKPQVSGEVLRVGVVAGQEVRKGDLLFQIDPRPFEAAVHQAEANLARDRAQRAQAEALVGQRTAEARQAEANLARDTAQLENAKTQERRYQELVQQDLVAKTQYEQFRTNALAFEATVQADRAAVENAKAGVQAAHAAVANAQAAIRADEAAVENARLQLAYCTIRSPIDGRAGDVLVNAGNVVKANPDNPLLVINQIRPIYVTYAVPEQYLGDIKRYRASGTLRVAAAVPNSADRSPIEGTLAFVNNAVDQGTGTIQLKATFPNADNALWPGQFVGLVTTLTEEANAVVIPSQSIQTGQKGPYVFVVKPDQSAEMRNVTVGRALGRETVIAEGLTPGEVVVTDGQVKLLPGSKVKIGGQPAAPAPAASPAAAPSPAPRAKS